MLGGSVVVDRMVLGRSSCPFEGLLLLGILILECKIATLLCNEPESMLLDDVLTRLKFRRNSSAQEAYFLVSTQIRAGL